MAVEMRSQAGLKIGRDARSEILCVGSHLVADSMLLKENCGCEGAFLVGSSKEVRVE